ncbi:MAG: hypothetical protein M1358_02705, partial [Chloroflexi bacterium]|nr:hypothetical protein [Chloroflexota bacterium]
ETCTPFFQCFFKYWPDCPYSILIGSNYKSYPDPRVSPILVGPDVDYSSNLKAMLARIEQDWVIIWLEDLFLSGLVDTSRICGLISVAQRKRGACLILEANRYSIVRVRNGGDEVVEICRDSPYRVSIGLGLWQKDVLSALLRPGETAWELERKGTERSRELEDPFLALPRSAVRKPPISTVHGLVMGTWTKEAVLFLQREGLGNTLLGFPQETLWSKVYRVLYARARYRAFSFLHNMRAATSPAPGCSQPNERIDIDAAG